MSQREDLIHIFITESRENIELLDQKIVQIEDDPENRAMLDEIFRAFHTLKGNSGIVGMKRFEKIAHITEEVLTQVRDGKRDITSEVITFLLDSLDQLKILHEAIEQTGEDAVDLEAIPAPQQIEKESARKRKAASSGKQRSATKSSKKAKEPTDEIIADDGSWGIFTQNLETDKELAQESEPQQEVDREEESLEPAPAAEPTGAARRQTDIAESWNKADSTIRVDVGLLDSLMNMVGELVLSRNQIMQFAQQIENANFHAASQRLDFCTSELQENVMKTRMQPISNVFSRFPRLVRDTTRTNNKRVDLLIEGEETELDKTIIEGIRDPLTHLVRNAIDHGIEDEETRTQLGKAPQGTLILRAYHEGGQVNLEIIDDGSGIDPEKIRQKAVAKGIMTVQQADTLSDRDAINLIFRPGFSTAEKITNISGRGVGMDVVKTNIEKIGGNVEISSVVGKGTTIRIKIPLTLAIIPALIITSGQQRFAIPQINLLELVRLEGDEMSQIERLGGAEIYRLRGKLLPILRLNNVLQLDSCTAEELESLSIVVLAAGQTQFGLIVDKIHDTEEIVVKPLSKHLKDIHAFAGATVMGDGKVALILDVVGLADTAKITVEENHAQAEKREQAHLSNRQSHTFLLFSIHADDQVAIPLSLVSRLEKTETSRIQRAGSREVIKYRGKILPLLRIENVLQIQPPAPKETFSVIVFAVENNEVGFIVSEILDIVDYTEEIDTSSLQQNGVLGSIIINEKITLILDAFALIANEFPDWFERKSQQLVQEQAKVISNILIVDDSPFIRAIERSYLEPEGYTVFEANNGDEALERMTSENIDLIITDIEMPKMGGLELTQNIRKNQHYKDLPIVAVSSLGSQKDQTRGLEAGVNDYLKKLNREDLLASLEKVISQIAK